MQSGFGRLGFGEGTAGRRAFKESDPAALRPDRKPPCKVDSRQLARKLASLHQGVPTRIQARAGDQPHSKKRDSLPASCSGCAPRARPARTGAEWVKQQAFLNILASLHRAVLSRSV